MNNVATGAHTDAVQFPYPVDLYRFDTSAKGISGGFPAVTEADIEYFHQYGYLVINDAFSPPEVEDALAGMVHLMDGKCPDFRAIQFEPKLVKQKDEMEVQERRDAIRKIFRFVDYEPRLNALASHSGLLGVLERIMGDTPELFQDMALVKPRATGRKNRGIRIVLTSTYRKEQRLLAYGSP